MGLRGPLPQTKRHAAKRLTDLAPPDWLCEEAASYWTRHADTLSKNELLTTSTADSFALCCDLWARVRAMSGEPTSRSYLDTVKSYTSLSKLFRLVPCDKPGQTDAGRFDDKSEFVF